MFWRTLHPEDVGSRILQNSNLHHVVSQPRRPQLPWKPQILQEFGLGFLHLPHTPKFKVCVIFFPNLRTLCPRKWWEGHTWSKSSVQSLNFLLLLWHTPVFCDLSVIIIIASHLCTKTPCHMLCPGISSIYLTYIEPFVVGLVIISKKQLHCKIRVCVYSSPLV